MARESDPSAHGDTVGDRDDRLRVLRDEGVESVLRAEEGHRLLLLPGGQRAVECTDIGPCRQSALPGAVKEYDGYLGVFAPTLQRALDLEDHAEIDRIDGFRAVHRQSADTVLDAGEDTGRL
ncbi:hypothetical protein BJ991_000986 [Microbacterium immunditiarum]|uniref:Uncharacterized protein n=1 Tax=Microbacterium immunditiarum TaxID=337480 RepID=A0A7Y9GLZ0_9MICO|nr:hypothetical protein [Microbacterium immunditiarum]